MPTFRITAPDGKTYDVTGPEGSTPEEALARVKAQHVQNDVPPSNPEDMAAFTKTPDNLQPHRDTLAEHLAYAPATRAAVGVYETLIGGPLQLGANIGSAAARAIGGMLPPEAQKYYDTQGPQLDQEIADKQKAWNDLKDSTMGGEMDIAGTLGNIAGGAAALAPGKTSITVLQGLQDALSTVPKTLPARMVYGGATGAALGAMTPSDKAGLEQNMKGALVGGATGFVAPAALDLGAWLGKVGYHAGIEPHFESGRRAIKGRAYLDATGDRADAVAQALRNYSQDVPGSQATAGEAAAPAGSAEFSAMQDSAEGVLPSEYLARGKERDAARLAQIRTVGKDEEALKIAQALRDKNAAQNYGAIRDQPIAPQADDALIQGEIANAERQKGQALQDAGRFATMAAQQKTLGEGGGLGAPESNTGSVSASAYPMEGNPPNIPGRGPAPDRAPGMVRSDAMPGSAFPIPGQPRVPPRYTENAQRAPEARAAVEDAMNVYETRKIEENWLKDMQAKLLEQSGGASKTGLEDFIGRPSIQDALGDARKTAAEAGIPFPKSPDEPFSVQNLQDIKESLDRGISATRQAETAGRRPEVSSEKLGNTRDAFIKWLESKSPEWGKARAQYKADSAPINQMKVGQYLEGKLTNSLDESGPQRAQSFATAVDQAHEAIPKRVTGDRVSKIVDALTPEQMQAVESVRKDLASMAEQQRMAKAGSRSGKDVLQPFTNSIDATGHSGQFPNMLNRGFMAMNFVLSRLRGKVDENLARELAQEMLNPQTTGRAIEEAIARRTRLGNTASALRSRSTQAGALAGAALGEQR